MVMRFFRRNFTVIIWFVVIIFILGFVVASGFSILQTEKNTAFKIGSTKYSLKGYQDRLSAWR